VHSIVTKRFTSIKSLQFFLVAARAGRLSTAITLHVTQAAVSQQSDTRNNSLICAVYRSSQKTCLTEQRAATMPFIEQGFESFERIRLISGDKQSNILFFLFFLSFMRFQREILYLLGYYRLVWVSVIAHSQSNVQLAPSNELVDFIKVK